MVIRGTDIARGLAGGLVAGAVWALAEAGANHVLGGIVPTGTAMALAGVDVALGALAGAVVALGL
ncbi:MAG TPA: hypothetical protein VKA21_16795, partial [Candidatus Binatia bacterium]|nr:hypothetical protein [Candidatus Binatia bacterium]